MRRIIKTFSYFVLSFICIIIILSYIYNQQIKHNLERNETAVNNKWTEYFLYSSDRIKLAKTLLKKKDSDTLSQSNINQYIDRNISIRNMYRKECKLDYVKLEFDVNKSIVDLLDTTNENHNKYFVLKDSFLISNIKLNRLVDEYNKSVMYNNEYISIFPNFIIAKRNGFKKKKYFSIRYGINNEDPIVKSKELPEWAIGVDTIL